MPAVPEPELVSGMSLYVLYIPLLLWILNPHIAAFVNGRAA
jgi:hypothetical protein